MSVANLDRLKREMLRAAVEQNLDLIHGRAARAPKPRRRRSWAARTVALSLVLPAGVLATTYPWLSHLGLSHPELAIEASAKPVTEADAVVVPALSAESAASDQNDLPEIIFPEIRPGEAPSPAWTAADVLAVERSPLDAQVFPLEVRRVVIDPGHGGDARGTQTPNGMTEKEITLDIALRLRPLLEQAGFEVLMTRESDRDVSLQERAIFANEHQADIFLSIHVNWFPDGGGGRGVETYYLGTAQEPYLNRLAAIENHGSGYALADMRRLLDRIYGSVRVSKSRELASAVHAALYRSLTEVNREIKNRGVKTAPFLVLVDTEMPAILAEVSCLSNDREAALLAQPQYRQSIAESLSRGIEAYADTAAGTQLLAAAPSPAGKNAP